MTKRFVRAPPASPDTSRRKPPLQCCGSYSEGRVVMSVVEKQEGERHERFYRPDQSLRRTRPARSL
jgi:hypothetical protein